MRDRLKYGVAFGIMSLAVFGLAIMSDHVVTMVAWLYFGITLALVSLAYLLHRPDLFGKRKDGSVPVWSYLVYLSYYQLNHLSLAIYRLQSAEAPWHQIAPGLFLGCRLRSSDKSAIDKLNITCVLDLTSEFSEVPFLRRAARYHNIPLLDATAPTLAELQTGLALLSESCAGGHDHIYIHCAAGHGRSATYALAWMLRRNPSLRLEEALRQVIALRPGVKLSRSQHSVLEDFASNPALPA